MCNAAINYVLDSSLEGYDRLLLLCIANRANQDGYMWASQVRLLLDTRFDRKTLIKRLQRLCDLGLLEKTSERVGRTRSVPVYRMIFAAQGERGDRYRPTAPVLQERCSSTADYNQKLRAQRGSSPNNMGLLPATQFGEGVPNEGGEGVPTVGTQNPSMNPSTPLRGVRVPRPGGADAPAPASPTQHAAVVGGGDHRAGNLAGPGADHRPATAHIPAQAGADGVQGARQGGRSGKPPEPASGPPEGRERVQAPSTVSPQAMMEAWNLVMEGCRIPQAGQMTARRAGQLARIARHPLIAGSLGCWKGYCRAVRADAWCRGEFTGRPISIEQAATVERLEQIHATDLEAQAERHLDLHGIAPDLPSRPVAAQDEIPPPPVREVPPELAALIRSEILDKSIRWTGVR